MRRRSFYLAGMIAAALVLLPPRPGLAGDGGTVTVDTEPASPRVGQTIRIPFTVFTHGTPIDYFGKQPVRPHLTATNRVTGDSLRIDGTKDGPVGRFAVDVTFPSAGEWSLVIKAEPLVLGIWVTTLTVFPATRAANPAANLGGALSQAGMAIALSLSAALRPQE